MLPGDFNDAILSTSNLNELARHGRQKNRKLAANKLNNTQNFARPAANNSNLTNGPQSRSKSVDELLAMTKEQLKNECRKRGQKSTGTKTELV
ncbi:hypothetical protein NQ318_002059 [Aromia moschata]|uniref:SAP domain-containing protein n=1 Tax=Aromia moschata TaxID=1265417 RepID=A0AAV8Z3B1_9CUCU|nr:hypothetical protein NQ318_002059 [Aromia moschata]